MKTKLIACLLILTLSLPLLAACGAQQAATETLKIGAVVWLGWPLGLDMKRGTEVMVALDNEAGGLDIGGKKYKVEVIYIDSNNDQAQTQAAVNKLIYEDKVAFIITDTMYPGSVLAETEKNKVIAATGSPIPTMFDPTYKYSFQGGFMFQATPEVAGWIATNVPEIKTVDMAYPDEGGGRAYAEGVKATLEAHGITVNPIMYPPASTDLSAIGTQVKNDNPTAFMACGNSGTDALVYQAVVQAGYKGLLFSTTTVTYETLKTAVPAEALEGFVGGAWPVEFDPAATEIAKQFKAKYIEMNGKWDGPEIQLTGAYSLLRAALEKAGTLDTTAVADVIANGLEFEGPTGKGKMIPRNDMGISRTVDSISEFCVKKIVNGAPTLLHTITLDEGASYVAPGVIQ
jgi:branched-chain amino acid transport system substrate-binding protein